MRHSLRLAAAYICLWASGIALAQLTTTTGTLTGGPEGCVHPNGLTVYVRGLKADDDGNSLQSRLLCDYRGGYTPSCIRSDDSQPKLSRLFPQTDGFLCSNGAYCS